MALSRLRYIIAGSAVLGVYTYFVSSSTSTTILSSNNPISTLHKDPITNIRNATLGFGRVYALGLPTRTDKRDGLQLAATLSNIELTWRDGVNGTEMHQYAIPPAHHDGTGFQKDGEVGCWRGHMNIIREIVALGIGSALILEDDADWDVNIHSQLEGLAKGTKESASLLPEENRGCDDINGSDNPYGTCWDVLWVGHCGGWAPGAQYSAYQSVIKGDKTVPPSWDMEDLTKDIAEPCAAHVGRKLNKKVVCQSPALQADERIVQYKPSPICTTGYAVSQRGARKMMARMGGLSLTDVDSNMDTELTELCRGDKDGNPPTEQAGNRDTFQCFSIVPPLILTHYPKGKMSGESDVNNRVVDRKMGSTRGAMYPTRLNIEALLKGKQPESQYIKDEKSGEGRYKTLKEYAIY